MRSNLFLKKEELTRQTTLPEEAKPNSLFNFKPTRALAAAHDTQVQLSLAPANLTVDSLTAGAGRTEPLLRYPLSPLDNAPQATVQKAEIYQHADSGQVFGSVALMPEEAPRDLLLAVFDTNGALRGIALTYVPAKAERAEIRPFRMPYGTSRYQLGLRPHVTPTEGFRVLGGDRAEECRGKSQLPPGVELKSVEFSQSSIHKDHFARLTVAKAEGYTAQMALFDAANRLIGVDQKPLSDGQIYLVLGVLPTEPARYELIVTKSQAQPDTSFLVETVKTEADGALLLLPKLAEHSWAEIKANPTLRDFTQVKLTATLVAALKEKGITEFVGKQLVASGKSTETLYLGFPASVVTTITVERLEDLQLMPKPAP